MRLANGNSEISGRVEVFHDGEWGTICDESFYQDEADFICRTLGYE